MGNGLAGCTNRPLDASTLQSVNQVNLGYCSVCPAQLYQNCSALGNEWEWSYSQPEGVGCKAVCKRIAYLNKDPNCCLGKQSSDPRRTCDPSLTPSNVTCRDPIISYCSKDENIEGNFCNSMSQDIKNNALRNYCNNPDNIKNKTLCRNFISSIDSGGKIDQTMSLYCKDNPDDDLCCYMNSTIPCPNKFDIRCFNKAAYQTGSMLATRCPDVLNCYQYANLAPNARLFATNVQMNCGSDTKIVEHKNIKSYSPLLTYVAIIILYSVVLYQNK